MPEISRFFGIVIRMFVEAGVRHDRPHCHAAYQGQVAAVAFDAVEVIGGALPKRQERLVLAWAEIHRNELLANWQALQAGRLPSTIEPLR